MKTKQNHNVLVIEVTLDELSVICNALNESLENIEEWEYHTRMGVPIEVTKTMLSELSNAYSAADSCEEEGE
jgi:hypothetical protein